MRLHLSIIRIIAATAALFIPSQATHEDPVAAPVPDNAKTITGTPGTPGHTAALNRWNEAKFGLFLHWGVYSVYGGTYKGGDLWSAEWIQENARIPYAEYTKTASEWNPSGFDAETWVRTAKDA